MHPSASPSDPEPRDAVDPAAMAEVTAWVGHLARALKTSRLYDDANPAVVRIRADLAHSLTGLLERHGALQLHAGTHTLAYMGEEVHATRSGEDAIAPVLHRDGVRALTLEPGIEARELDALIDGLLQVTGPAAGDDDLVTFLWDADLPHVTVETVPLEGEVDGGEEDAGDSSPGTAWPQQEPGSAAPAPPAAAEFARALSSGPGAAGTASPPPPSRSDDWVTGESTIDLEQAFDEYETGALVEIARFQRNWQEARGAAPSAAAIRIIEDCFAGGLTPSDRAELSAFVHRVLVESLAAGDWMSADVALTRARDCEPDGPTESFFRDLCGPQTNLVRRAVSALDGQDETGVTAFLALAKRLGSPAVEWLMHLLVESERMQVRRPLARAIAELAAERPDVILPWLADERWYVVRNAVHILGWIGGEALGSVLSPVAGHLELRVRHEVVAALGQVGHDAARPVLLAMLENAETPLMVAILQGLALDTHPSVQEPLLEMLFDEGFARRPDEERRALLAALASRGDAILPALEAELNRGGLFSRRPEPDRTAIAVCVARIGTPAARAILERGLQSGRKALVRACRIASASGGGPHA